MSEREEVQEKVSPRPPIYPICKPPRFIYTEQSVVLKQRIQMAADIVGKEEITKEEAALAEFKAGVVRSIKQYKEGLVETFDTVEDFLDDLHSE